ncbi:MAG TPA: hypothetical protein VH083_07680 [Myxococcales bacterium]|jgi:hypothetical protein|nr:hypothetical protein [Myxococcales bacterium]
MMGIVVAVLVAQVAPELPLAGVVERIANLSCRPEVAVHPLERTISVRCKGGITQLLKAKSEICPTAERDGVDGVVFRCATSLLAAHANEGSLQIFKLRGLPVRGEDGPPPTPLAAELDKACGPSAPPLRAADAALAGGDVSIALAALRDVGRTGPCGRLATERLCELTGEECLRRPVVFDRSGFSGSLLQDLLLREARVRAFTGHPFEAVEPLMKLGQAGCASNALCRHILVVVLRELPQAPTADALALALSLPSKGPHAVSLTRAEADTSALLGAPRTGATLLAAITAQVGAADLPDHLLRTAELYRAAQDEAHAAAVTEFAQTKLPAATFASPRWRAVMDESPKPKGFEHAALDKELEAARTAASQAHGVPARGSQ